MSTIDEQSERKAFNNWMVNVAKIIIGSSDPYPAGLERDYWEVWLAAKRQAREEFLAMLPHDLKIESWMSDKTAYENFGWNNYRAKLLRRMGE